MSILTPFYPFIVAVLLFTNAISGAMWFINSKDATVNKAKAEQCAADHRAFVSQVDAQGKLAAERAKQTEEQNRRIADETANGWAAALGVVRGDADRRLRIVANRSALGGGVSLPGAPAGGTHGAAESDLPPAGRVLADCAEDVLTLVWLQDWVRKTSGVEDISSPSISAPSLRSTTSIRLAPDFDTSTTTADRAG